MELNLKLDTKRKKESKRKIFNQLIQIIGLLTVVDKMGSIVTLENKLCNFDICALYKHSTDLNDFKLGNFIVRQL